MLTGELKNRLCWKLKKKNTFWPGFCTGIWRPLNSMSFPPALVAMNSGGMLFTNSCILPCVNLPSARATSMPNRSLSRSSSSGDCFKLCLLSSSHFSLKKVSLKNFMRTFFFLDLCRTVCHSSTSGVAATLRSTPSDVRSCTGPGFSSSSGGRGEEALREVPWAPFFPRPKPSRH